MKFLLILKLSSAFFLPTGMAVAPFETLEQCELALYEAKKEWQVINDQSRCVDIGLQEQIKIKEAELKQLKSRK